MTALTPRLAPLLIAILLLALYGVRAGTGWIGGTAYSKGRRLSAVGMSERALPLLERGAVGEDRAASLWLAGEARLGLYQAGLTAGAGVEELGGLLSETYRLDTKAITLSPASGWYWASLADVYHQVERRQRFSQGLPLDLVGQDRWAFVGRPGRIAVGMLRMAIEREPNVYVFHDQLAFVLLDYGLRDQALEAVQRSARAQPDFNTHAYTRLDPLPEGVLDAFAEASRDALGQAPLFPRVKHLASLGRLEMRRRNPRQAERDLRASLEEHGTRLQRADSFFWLGLSLEAQLRFEEAIAALVESQKNPVFEPASLAARARIAEGDDDPRGALDLLREARRSRPMELGYAMAYARIARSVEEWTWAEESLRWAVTVHPDNPRPLRELESLYLERGNRVGAEKMRRELERLTEGSSGGGGQNPG